MIWKEEYAIGVPKIDVQHEELFARVTAFVNTVCAEKDWAEKVAGVNDTLAFMKDYVITHFRDEEEYQTEIGYPNLQEHKEIHRDMVDYIEGIAAEYEKNGYREIVMQQFVGKLVTWIVNHVVAEDQRIGDFAKSKE